MAEIFQQLYSINIVSYVGVQDFADTLSFQITVSLLTACCAWTTIMCYMWKPVACFQHNTFGEFMDGKDLAGQIEYSTNYCWTEGTYAVHPNNFSIDVTAKDGGMSAYADKKIVYYQWVPFLLALQALMFYAPRLLWNSISYDRAGTDVGHIIKVASDAGREEEEAHDKLITYAVRMIEVMLGRTQKCQQERRLVEAKQRFKRILSIALPSRLKGSWLIFTYLIIKLAYLGNALGQLVLMQHFLQLRGSHYHMLGYSLLRDIVSGRDWHNSMAFPRVGCCAVFIRSGAAGNWQFCQCTLPVNIVNEKIYIFLWFWFIFVAASTLVSTLAWLYRLINASLTCRFVKKYLRLADNYNEELRHKKAILRDFTHQFLKRDGTFILKMIALNAGDVVCAEIIQRLWQHHLLDEGYMSDEEPAKEAEPIDQAEKPAASQQPPAEQPDQQVKPKSETGILKLPCNGVPQKREGVRQRRRRSSTGASVPVAATLADSADSTANATLPLLDHQARGTKLTRGVSFNLDDLDYADRLETKS